MSVTDVSAPPPRTEWDAKGQPFVSGNHGLVITAITRFITERPDNDAGVIEVPSNHPTHALHIRADQASLSDTNPAGVLVCLDVCLINNVHTQTITES